MTSPSSDFVGGSTARKRSPEPVEAGGVRRIPVRDPQPPFDDEIGIAVRPGPLRVVRANMTDSAGHLRVAPNTDGPELAGHHQVGLTLAFTLPSGLPAVPDLPAVVGDVDHTVGSQVPRLHLVSPTEVAPAGDVESPGSTKPRRRAREAVELEFGPLQTPRVALPDPKPWAGRLVQAVIEVAAGLRPASQLVRWTTTDVYDVVQRRAMRSVHDMRAGTSRQVAEIVRSLHISEPGDGIAEVCAIVQQGPRCRAIALRLEGLDGRWQCTALHIG